jgi:hypothetical protein
MVIGVDRVVAEVQIVTLWTHVATATMIVTIKEDGEVLVVM